ncbi:MAG: hypothetical protein Q7R56_00380 [Nanoarchaeota archaeon]|nr:hypothetical protein [Nanoarchaeota archaeon]
MVKVIKRSGKQQVFSVVKIRKSVLAAAKDARLSAAKTKQVVEDVSMSIQKSLKGKKVIRSVDLRKKILGRLDRLARSVARAWREYDNY